jgi:hypothetical protein
MGITKLYPDWNPWCSAPWPWWSRNLHPPPCCPSDLALDTPRGSPQKNERAQGAMAASNVRLYGAYGGFHKWGSPNSWMVYNGNSIYKMIDDGLGVSPFWEIWTWDLSTFSFDDLMTMSGIHQICCKIFKWNRLDGMKPLWWANTPTTSLLSASRADKKYYTSDQILLNLTLNHLQKKQPESSTIF